MTHQGYSARMTVGGQTFTISEALFNFLVRPTFDFNLIRSEELALNDYFRQREQETLQQTQQQTQHHWQKEGF